MHMDNDFQQRGKSSSVGERIVSSTNGTGATEHLQGRHWTYISTLTIYKKIWKIEIIDLNVKPKILKCLEGNTRENLYDLRVGKDFSDRYEKHNP